MRENFGFIKCENELIVCSDNLAYSSDQPTTKCYNLDQLFSSNKIHLIKKIIMFMSKFLISTFSLPFFHKQL